MADNQFNIIGGATVSVSEYVIEESCGAHDLLTVQGTGMDLSNSTGKPAKLSIYQGSRSREIVGYVDTHVSSSGRKSETVNALYMLGASSVMRSGSERQWKSKRPFDIASEIVRPYGFCLEMDIYKYTIPMFAQSAESDWQLLARLANEIGMVLIGTNTVIRIVDPVMEIRRRKLRPLLTVDVNVLANYNISQTPVPLGYEGRVYQGIDRFNQSFSVTANPTAAVILPAPETVRSLEDAFSAVERIERRRHRMRKATCTVKYTPILRSGTTLGLSNGVDRRVWFISESRHSYKRSESPVTDLVLHRDIDDQVTAIDTWRGSLWPTPVLLNGRWVSSQRWEREL